MPPYHSQRLPPQSIIQAVFAAANGAAIRTTVGRIWVVEGVTASLGVGESATIEIERANENGMQRRFRLLSVAVGTKGRNCKVTILHRLYAGATASERHLSDLDGSETTDYLKFCDPHDIHAQNAQLRITHDGGAATAYRYQIVGEDLQTRGEDGQAEA